MLATVLCLAPILVAAPVLAEGNAARSPWEVGLSASYVSAG
jgi:hypothetical protein